MIKGLLKCVCYIGKLLMSVEYGLKMLKFVLLFFLVWYVNNCVCINFCRY